jgi:acetylornithine deacetylase
MISHITDYVPREEIVHWVQEFVRYASPQTEKFEAEPAVLGFIEECFLPLLKQRQMRFRRDEMGNVIVEIGPDGVSGKSLLFMAYAMTHPAGRMHEPYRGELIQTDKGEAIRGRGIAEQKGCLAAALAAATASLIAGKLQGRLVFTLSTAGETGRHDAAISILKALDVIPPLGVVVVGTSGNVCLGNKGRIDVIIKVRGKACHSSTPWMGIDALRGSCEVIARLDKINLSSQVHPKLGSATLTPTAIRSFPEATHTVQDEVCIVYDRRLLPGQDPNDALEQIEETLHGISPLKVEVSRGAFMYPCEIKEDGALLMKVREGYRLAGLEEPRLFYSHGALDAGFLNLNSCESTMWGPGAIEQWHSDNEALSVEDLVNGAQAYLGFIHAVLGGEK